MRSRPSARSAPDGAGSVGPERGQADPPPFVDEREADGRVLDDRPRPPPTRTAPPPSSPVNTGPGRASNDKQERAREAEEDRALIARVQAGDTAAFRRLVERHQRRAFAIALALVRDENDAREVVQEAFLRVFKGLPTFQGGSAFFTWLYRIVTNLSIDLMRKPGRRMTDLEEARLDTEEADDNGLSLLSRFDGADPADVVRRREIGAQLQTALDALSSYHRAVIVLREIEGLSYEEMAQAMNVSKGTIMSRLFHARQRLQRALADCYREQMGAPPPGTRDGASDEAHEDAHEDAHDDGGGDGDDGDGAPAGGGEP